MEKTGQRDIRYPFVFLFALAIRLLLLSKGPFHYDAVELIMASQRTVESGALQYMHGAGYPLHVLLGTFFIQALAPFGATPVQAVNLMSAVFSSLAVLALFSALRRLLDARAAAFTSLLYAVFPALVSSGVYAINNGTAAFFALCSLALLLRHLDSSSSRDLVLSGLMLGCCVAVRLSDALFLLPLLVLLRKAPARRLWLFAVPFVALPLALYLPMVLRGETGQIALAFASPLQGHFAGVFSDMIRKYSLKWMSSMLTWAGTFLALPGSVLLFLKKREAFYFLLAWFLVFFIYYGNITTVEPRMFVLAGVPALTAIGFLFSSLFRERAALGAVSLVSLQLLMLLPVLPVLTFRHERNVAGEYFTWLARVTDPRSVIIAVDDAVFLEFYSHRKSISPPVTCDPKRMKEFARDEIDPLLARGIPVYILPSTFAYDDCDVLQRLLEDSYRIVFAGKAESEDWHHACLELKLGHEQLFKIESKTGAENENSDTRSRSRGADGGTGAAGAGAGEGGPS